ncbi:hypothetical protein [Aureimonas sp. N4]|uniref:hypothetical protein n=1 Tax=Aureimonas sp. N4 TaxID=1638165 RepID=UPI000783EE74|nr:hypothetical protein [Aureimonas sp. N4]
MSKPDIDHHIFFDGETLPTNRADVIEHLDAKIEVPSNMSKPETIEAWYAEKRPGVLKEAVAKTSFDGGFGRIASIAFAVGNGPVVSATSARPAVGDVPAAYDIEKERKLLGRFFAACNRVRNHIGKPPTLVGHNIVAFDVRWLWKRSIVLGVEVPEWWPVEAKPWQKEAVFDTMTVWEGVGGRISQDRLALALGLPTKSDFDGLMVADAWERGEFERIRTYNGDDVETVRSIWKRIVGWREPAVASETVAEAPVETKEERDAAVDAAVKTSQNGAGFKPGLRPGFRPAVRAESSAHATTGAAA